MNVDATGEPDLPAGGASAMDSGQVLLDLLRGLPVEGFEKSFKMADGTLLCNRYLLGIQKSAIAPATLFRVCEQIRMPSHHLTALQQQLSRASTVHFGFEQGEKTSIYKVYLEFAPLLHRALQAGASNTDAVLLHLAYKWDVQDQNKSTVAKYHCFPALSMDGVLERHAALYAGQAAGASLEMTRHIIDLAARRAPGALMYLEVSEENNLRRSFDLNLHEAGLRVEDIEIPLLEIRRLYSIPAAEFKSMFDQIRSDKLGHLSGGISREGREFVTVYHEGARG